MLITSTLLGVYCGLLREASALSAFVLASEPLPALLGIWAVHLCFSRGNAYAGLFAALSTCSFLLTSRLVDPLPLSPGDPSVFALSSCEPMMPKDLILTHWVGANDADAVGRFLKESDVVVLDRPTIDLAALVPEAGGDIREVREGLYVWAHAGFAACGDTDVWPVQGRGGLVFAAPSDTTAVPLFVADFGDDPLPLVAQLAAFVDHVGSLGTLIIGVGDFPTSYTHTEAGFVDLGLVRIATPPNAPYRILGLPALTLRPTTRVWVGPLWQGRARVRDANTLRAPVVLRLDAYQTP